MAVACGGGTGGGGGGLADRAMPVMRELRTLAVALWDRDPVGAVCSALAAVGLVTALILAVAW